MSDKFAVKTEVFEGPLELLLHLIEKRKLFINDIALAEVADDYIGYIQRFENFPTKEVAHFVLVASTLVLIKSKSLLPQLQLTEEEQTDIEDLERRLKIYKKIQHMSKVVESRFGKEIIFMPSESQHVDPVFVPHTSITIASLSDAMQSILRHLPKKEKVKKAIVEKVMSLEEMLETLTTRITSALKMSFNNFAKAHTTGKTVREAKVNMIVSFLAMLELVKQGVLSVTQHEAFKDINMESREAGIPRYE